MKKLLGIVFLGLLLCGNAYAGEPYSKYIIPLDIWLIGTVAMIVSLFIFGFLADYKIPEKFNNFYYYLLIGFKFIIMIFSGFICLIGWGVWFWGLSAYFLDLIGFWFVVLIIPFFLLMNVFAHLYQTYVLPKLSSAFKIR